MKSYDHDHVAVVPPVFMKNGHLSYQNTSNPLHTIRLNQRIDVSKSTPPSIVYIVHRAVSARAFTRLALLALSFFLPLLFCALLQYFHPFELP